jgi:hypothetical protein
MVTIINGEDSLGLVVQILLCRTWFVLADAGDVEWSGMATRSFGLQLSCISAPGKWIRANIGITAWLDLKCPR